MLTLSFILPSVLYPLESVLLHGRASAGHRRSSLLLRALDCRVLGLLNGDSSIIGAPSVEEPDYKERCKEVRHNEVNSPRSFTFSFFLISKVSIRIEALFTWDNFQPIYFLKSSYPFFPVHNFQCLN